MQFFFRFLCAKEVMQEIILTTPRTINSGANWACAIGNNCALNLKRAYPPILIKYLPEHMNRCCSLKSIRAKYARGQLGVSHKAINNPYNKGFESFVQNLD